MTIRDFEIELRNQVSTGGFVVLRKGNGGEVAISLEGGDKTRRDCRVDVKELMKASKLIEAGVFDN